MTPAIRSPRSQLRSYERIHPTIGTRLSDPPSGVARPTGHGGRCYAATQRGSWSTCGRGRWDAVATVIQHLARSSSEEAGTRSRLACASRVPCGLKERAHRYARGGSALGVAHVRRCRSTRGCGLRCDDSGLRRGERRVVPSGARWGQRQGPRRSDGRQGSARNGCGGPAALGTDSQGHLSAGRRGREDGPPGPPTRQERSSRRTGSTSTG